MSQLFLSTELLQRMFSGESVRAQHDLVGLTFTFSFTAEKRLPQGRHSVVAGHETHLIMGTITDVLMWGEGSALSCVSLLISTPRVGGRLIEELQYFHLPGGLWKLKLQGACEPIPGELRLHPPDEHDRD